MHGTLDFAQWSAARVEDLRRLIEEKCSASEAARELGITRNAAIGKAHRLGLSFKSIDPRNVYLGRQGIARLPPAPRIRRKAMARAKLPEMAPEPGARNLTFQQLEKNDCRYVVTADHPMLFCGHGKIEGSSYCEFHHHLCWKPPAARNRDARPR